MFARHPVCMHAVSRFKDSRILTSPTMSSADEMLTSCERLSAGPSRIHQAHIQRHICIRIVPKPKTVSTFTCRSNQITASTCFIAVCDAYYQKQRSHLSNVSWMPSETKVELRISIQPGRLVHAFSRRGLSTKI